MGIRSSDTGQYTTYSEKLNLVALVVVLCLQTVATF